MWEVPKLAGDGRAGVDRCNVVGNQLPKTGTEVRQIASVVKSFKPIHLKIGLERPIGVVT